MNIFSSIASFLFDDNRTYDLQKAQKIAGQGDYEMIREELSKKNMLPRYSAFVREKYASVLKENDFVATKEDWEKLAILWLYDTEVAEHCLRVFSLAKRLATLPFSYEKNTILLETLLKKNNISLEQFLRASLFHDIGKIALPREVINNTIDDCGMGEIFMRLCRLDNRDSYLSNLGLDLEKIATPEEALEKLFENGLRPKDAVPIREIFAGEKTEILKIIAKNGFSADETLGEIISRHEEEGEKIFQKIDPKVANLILHHHPGAKLSKRKRKEDTSRMHDIEFMIALVDESDAFEHARSYKSALPKIVVLFELTKEVKNGRLDRGLVYLWVQNEYQKIDPKEKTGKFQKDIETFLANEKNKNAVERLISG